MILGFSNEPCPIVEEEEKRTEGRRRIKGKR